VWDVNCDTESGDNWFSAQMHAETGELLQIVDWVSEAKYNVYPIGVNGMVSSFLFLLIITKNRVRVEDPSDGERRLIVSPEDATASPLGWHDQGQVGRGRGDHEKFTSTVGNNVWAQNNPNGRSGYEQNYRPDGGAELNFDFDLDLKKQPSDYVDAAITNLFYWNNIMHDLFYKYGFDEKSGNFQEDNFGRGGKGNDAVIANAQGMSLFAKLSNRF
jgi:extracellular elastinolytic metalloproteinase